MPDNNMRPKYKTCRRLNIPGHSHFLTFSCFRRQHFLSKDRTRQWLADAIAAARSKHDFALLAWVFMPEHAHLILWPRKPQYDISQILSSIKIPVTRKSRWFVTHNAPNFIPRMLDVQPNGEKSIRFWQRGGGFDRNLYTAAELWEKIDYVHRNPVKRELVERATDWRWSSAVDYAGSSASPIPVDTEHLPDRPS